MVARVVNATTDSKQLRQAHLGRKKIGAEDCRRDRLETIKFWVQSKISSQANQPIPLTNLMDELTELVNTFTDDKISKPSETLSPRVPSNREEKTLSFPNDTEITRQEKILKWARKIGMNCNTYQEVVDSSIEFFYPDVERLVKGGFKELQMRGDGVNDIDLYDLVNRSAMNVPELIAKHDPDEGDFVHGILYKKIKFDLREFFRRNDFVPRTVRELASKIEVHNSDPNNEKLAIPSQILEATNQEGESREYLFMTCLRALAVANGRYDFSIDPHRRKNEDCNGNFIPIASPERSFKLVDLRESLDEATGLLDMKDKIIFLLYNLLELKMKEIGYILNLHHSRASQLIKRIETKFHKAYISDSKSSPEMPPVNSKISLDLWKCMKEKQQQVMRLYLLGLSQETIIKESSIKHEHTLFRYLAGARRHLGLDIKDVFEIRRKNMLQRDTAKGYIQYNFITFVFPGEIPESTNDEPQAKFENRLFVTLCSLFPTLTKAQRKDVKLYIQGMQMTDIARLTGKSQKGVCRRLNHASENIRAKVFSTDVLK